MNPRDKEILSQNYEFDKNLPSWKGELSDFKIPTTPEEIREARKKRVIITMLCAYGDESSDADEARTFAVAGIVETQEGWDAIKPAWVEATEGRVFHATDNQSGSGKVYGSISKAKCDEEYIKLTNILVKSKIFGYGFAVDIAAFKEYLPESLENSPYYHCFSKVIMGLAEFGYLSIPREKVKFTFDQNTKVRHNCGLMLKYLSNLFEYNYSEYIDNGELSFALSRDKIQLQAADLFAHEVMKELDNQIGPVNRDRRKPLIALYRTGRFRWDVYKRQDFEFMSKQLEYLEKQDSSWRKEYQEWLAKTKRKNDNDTHRFEFLIYCKEKERKKQQSQLLVLPIASNRGSNGCD